MESFVTIEVFHSPIQADVARDYLEQAGIQAYLVDDHTVAVYGLLNSALGGVKLQVKAADEHQARQLLDEVRVQKETRATAEPVLFECSECQGKLEFPGHRRGRVETCRHCGQYVDVPEANIVSPPGSGNQATVGSSSDEPQDGSSEGTAAEKVSSENISSENAGSASDQPARRIPLRLEIPSVLAFIYLPLVVSAFLTDSNIDYGYSDFISLFSASLQTTIPLVMILVLLGEGLERFGLKKFHLVRDCLLGLGIYLVIILVNQTANIVYAAAFEIGLPETYDQYGEYDESGAESYRVPLLQPGWYPLMWCLIGLIANSVAEELCMRGYLITRLTDLWGNRALSVLLSSALFGSYHIYQGLPAASWIAVEGILFGVSYLIIKSIWPLVIAHTLINLTIYLA